MQVILKNEDEGGNSRGTSVVGSLVCIGGVSRYLERKHNGGIGVRGDGI